MWMLLPLMSRFLPIDSLLGLKMFISRKRVCGYEKQEKIWSR